MKGAAKNIKESFPVIPISLDFRYLEVVEEAIMDPRIADKVKALTKEDRLKLADLFERWVNQIRAHVRFVDGRSFLN